MSAPKNRPSRNSGFTLLELIIVMAVLGTIAGGAILMVGQTEESAQCKIGLVEVCEIREALIQFKKDTGSLPKRGVFALTTEGGSVPVPVEGSDWFHSPANFSQLFENPLSGTGHPIGFVESGHKTRLERPLSFNFRRWSCQSRLRPQSRWKRKPYPRRNNRRCDCNS